MSIDDGAPPAVRPVLRALLRAWRERALLTQEQLAARTGLGVRTIRRLESGGMRPRSESVRRLASALRLSDGELAELTAAARGGSARSSAAAARVIPGQLPADVAGFTGRARHLARLDALLAEGRAAGAMPISAITGPAGVGKTALAVRWAHKVANRFPDGQLHLNLAGYAPGKPPRPIQALAQLLHGLGVPADQVPVEVGAAAGLYRSLLARRRVLVVLDNARDAEQVRQLLPGSASCLVLVTSRDRLTGLVASHGAQRLDLDVLSPAEAVTLLARIVGDDRVAAEPEAAAELAGLCGHLPLALRIAAANLAGRPGTAIAGYAAELGAGDRLANLAIDGDAEAAVCVAFDRSYAALDPQAQRLFRLLGTMPCPEVSVPAAAALAGSTRAKAARVLRRLAAGHLLEAHGADRFTFHDLLRHYARQRAVHEDRDGARQAATRRLLGWYLLAADAADLLVSPGRLRLQVPAAVAGLPPPGFDQRHGALAWLDTERRNLVAAVQYAAEHGPKQLAWLLADALLGYLVLRRHTIDWLTVGGAGLAAAAEAGDRRAQATAHFSLGLACWSLGRHPQAVEHHTAALELFKQAGWSEGQARIRCNLGMVYTDTGRLKEAADHIAQAIELHRRAGRREAQANALCSMGVVHRERGELASAADHQDRALALYREIGSRSGEAYALDNLGEIDHDLGLLDAAFKRLSQALDLYREVGNRSGEAYALHALAAVCRDAGRLDEARELAEGAVSLARETSERRIHAEALNTLGSIHLRLGCDAEAVLQHTQALDLACQTGIRYAQTGALLGLAAADERNGRRDLAIDHAEQALALAREAGYRLLGAQARTILAAAHLGLGHDGIAIEQARKARAVQMAAGQRLGHARTLVVLGNAMRRTDGPAAVATLREATALLDEIGAPEAREVRELLG